MSSPRSHSEYPEDQHTGPWFDAGGEENEDDDPDYDEDEAADDDELDEDDMTHDMFEDDDEFYVQDAEEGNINIIVQVQGQGQGGEAPQDGPERSALERRVINLIANVGRRTGVVSQREILNLLRGHNLGILVNGEEDDDDYSWGPRSRGRRHPDPDPNRFPKVPSEKGTELMNSGTFGANDVSSPSMIPRTDADMIINYDENVYSGQFSADGNFFYACVKDFKVRMYDTSNPYDWKHYKTVSFPFGSWTLTDASLSPDNKWLAYTSIQSNVCLAPTDQ
ncbi:hypothetical protein NUW58_g2504 [Xylaria curta]|uniref:Uncharacterized protein n=1 Tax=Xylaria curta TaxID=42375 RepID=A0ACC1PHM1_9PEZI|nr:hypothetical protein NUW58_g2504 [Xylaria curta]